MGGLVAQEYRYSERSAGANIKKIITIGTPLLGTHVAHLASWVSESAKEMLYKSDFVKNLQRQAKTDLYTEYDTIATRTDYIVRPILSALGEKKPRSTAEVLNATGHISYLFSPSVARQLEESLHTVQPAAQTA